MRYMILLSLLLPCSLAWISQGGRSRTSFLKVRMPGEVGDVSPNAELQRENPCWQDIYDDDCSMSNVYAASFVASKWMKSMPCAQGLEDCDMPEELTTPLTRHKDDTEEDVEDLLGYLGVKRAEAIKRHAAEVSHGEDLKP